MHDYQKSTFVYTTNDVTDVLFEYLISQEQEEIWKKYQSIILPFHIAYICSILQNKTKSE